MKLHFEPNLDFQRDAVDAVCDLFRGQERCRTEFTVTWKTDESLLLQAGDNGLGIGNRLSILDDELLTNLRDVQFRNKLPPADKLESMDFTVEMETGTGKTYVYLRTIFELNRRFGFTKFVIVVPSVAIKEGVYKTLQITDEHFAGLYDNPPRDCFVYDSAKLGQVRDFATSPHIRIMVVTVGAINKKDVNNLYKESEKTGGERPIDLIRETRPILIVDEPQSVDGGLEGRGKEALGAMNPLCTLRYSATHQQKFNMVYRLDAIDAYNRKLVKQIEVASATVEGGFNKPYIKLLATSNKGGRVTASVELDVQGAGGALRATKTVSDGDDLEQVTKRAVYANHIIGEISADRTRPFMEVRIPGTEQWLTPGEAINDVDQDAVTRQLIRRTIREHLDKERRLRPRGIKVLSLFFLGAVADYRLYDESGNAQKGPCALLFEEEYRKLMKHPDYRDLFGGADVETEPELVHDGYFSIDRRGGKDFVKDTTGATKADDDTYALIMKDKERLLSLDTRLKFIFSHSALREGWDNPNVFQICTLRDMKSEMQRRQTIGRGLRLCVAQDGQRVRDTDTNVLTVVATGSYEEFAHDLQKEIERDTGFMFGHVGKDGFAAVGVRDGRAETPLGIQASREIWQYLRNHGFVDGQGKVLDTLRTALKDKTFALPEEFAAQTAEIVGILTKAAGSLEIRNADERVTVKTREKVLWGPDFKELWDRIRQKTMYRVAFDNERLISECTRAVAGMPQITRTRITFQKAGLGIVTSGVICDRVAQYAPTTVEEGDIVYPDLLTDLQDRTQLTRRTIVRILLDSGRLDDFRRNPQEFIDLAATAINKSKRQALVDGIKYSPLDGEVYAQELFETEELTAYLKNALPVEKSVYTHVIYDSAGVERSFAQDLEANDSVKVYAKLPPWFTVPTPLGSYNPDWAVLVQTEEGDRLYFVVETKGSQFLEDLRGVEQGKIKCARGHFGAVAADSVACGEIKARYQQCATVNELLRIE